MRGKWLFIVPAAIVGMVVFTALGGLVIRWLWNWLLPPLFGWPTITFWQAIAMLALCRILFGGLGLHNSGRSRFRRRMSERFTERMAERWEHMTPEERERFRRGVGEFWGYRPPAPEGDKQ